VYGLENIVDAISSFVVLWRFFAPTTNINDELERKLQGREDKASIAINWILLILGLLIILSSFSGFVRGRHSSDNDNSKTKGVIISSFISTIVFGIICTIKFRMSKLLQSDSLYKDGLCSFIGTILSAALFLHAAIFANTGLWWLDPFLSLLAGLFAIYYGLTSLYYGATTKKIGICCCCTSSSSNGPNTFSPSGTSTDNNVELGNAPDAINDNDVV
jgi:multisubunit Na+/H+ antiporter MnhF subunit